MVFADDEVEVIAAALAEARREGEIAMRDRAEECCNPLLFSNDGAEIRKRIRALPVNV